MSTQRALFVRFILAPLLLVIAPMAAGDSEIANRVKLFLDHQGVAGGEVEITVGDPDPRLQLAACKSYEPFVPTGARLWGRTTLGVRCVDGAAWTVYLPTQVRVFALGLVAARPIVRGQPVGPEDVRAERLEISALPAGLLAASDPPEGKIAARSIGAGEPLRRDYFQSPAIFKSGDLVRVLAGGAGFAISTEGRALTGAYDGQTAQVALIGGRVVTGIARPGRVVEIR